MGDRDFYAFDPDVGGLRQVLDDDLLYHRPDEDDEEPEPAGLAEWVKTVLLVAAVVATVVAVFIVAAVRAGRLA